MNTEIILDIGYLKVAAKLWGPESGQPTIALHGYLDNANSFDMIAPHLSGLRICAMDFAGHGLSEHRRHGELYSGLNDIRDILAVADQFGWKTFNVLGHSMGAEIGSQLAGLFPERVEKLICIDGYSGTNQAKNTLDHFRSTIASSFKTASNLKVFPTLEAMTERLSQATGQNPTSARCIIDRGHAKVEGGYTWRTDPRIKGSGPFELAQDQFHDLLDRTMAETLFIVADMENTWLKRSIDLVTARDDEQMTLVSLPGHHHLHMQDHSDQVVTLINDFVRPSPAKSLKKTA
ncbi:MAG: pimeloyl-ACP methyl ester carboxylesterase [Candidatus Azotimanducaceae bacterium]